MIIPITEALARLAAAAGITGLTGACPPAAPGPLLLPDPAGSGVGLVFSCISLTPP
jgi:hypothetical protein